MTNKQKEEDAKEELKRLIILGNLANDTTAKLPKIKKYHFDVKTVVETDGYSNPYFPRKSHGAEYDKAKDNKLSRYDFKKHARQLLNTSDVDQMLTLQQLQKDRLSKIEDIERSIKVDDYQGYTDGASKLSNLNSRFPEGYKYSGGEKGKFIGTSSELINTAKRNNHSVDGRRDSDSTLLDLKFEPKGIKGARHLDDPFIYGLGLKL